MLITGASRGIGAACAIRLAMNNFHILVNYAHNEKAALLVQESILNNGGTADLLKMDVANRDEVAHVLSDYLANPDHDIDILINNAGIRRDNAMVWMTYEDWDQVMQIHLDGFFHVTKHVLQSMIMKRWGRIINIVSLSGLSGMAGQVNYAAAKAGIIGATKSLALELAKRKITVNAVAPGYIATDMTDDIDENHVKNHIPMKRFGQPEEVASLVNFLASEESGYITGEVISINGGLYT